MMVKDCPLCPAALDRGKIKESNELSFFFDLEHPILSGSGMVLPKAHRETVFDLSPEEHASAFELLSEVKARVDRELRPDGYNVGWNCGAVAGQSVPHCHMHVVPRFRDEPFASRGIRYWLKQEGNRRGPAV